MAGAISPADVAGTMQDKLKQGLIQKITNESIFLRILKFIPVPGMGYEYGEQATLGSVGFRGLGESYTGDVGVVNPKKERLAILGGIVPVDRIYVDVGGLRASAIAAKMRKAGLVYDRTVIKGNSATNPKEFDGLMRRLTGNQVVVNAANGTTIQLDKIATLIDRVKGPNERKVLIMNKAVRRQLLDEVMANAGGAGIMDIGKSLGSYDNVPVKVLDEDGDESPILDFNEDCGTSHVCTSVYCIAPGQDEEGEDVQGLIKGELVEHEDQGTRGTQHIDLVEMCAGLGVFHGRAAARLMGISAS